MLPLLLLVSFAPPAMAYIDPGAGSIAIQLLMAACLAGLFKIRALLMAIRRWFRKMTGRQEID
jgi:hypothetical protein